MKNELEVEKEGTDVEVEGNVGFSTDVRNSHRYKRAATKDTSGYLQEFFYYNSLLLLHARSFTIENTSV